MTTLKESEWLLKSNKELMEEIKLESINSDKLLQIKVNEMEKNYNQFNQRINSTLKLLSKYFTGTDINETLELNEKYLDICSQNNRYLLIIFTSLILLTLIIMFGTCFRLTRGCSCFLAYFLFILIAAITLITFIALIVSSDVCINFDIFLLKNFKENNIKSFYEYYLRCPDLAGNQAKPETKNEWEKFFADIDSKLINTDQLLILFEAKLNDIINEHCNEEANEKICLLFKQLNENNSLAKAIISYIRVNIINKAKCRTLSPLLNGMESHFCTDTYQALFYIFTNALLSTGQYYVISIIILYFLFMF